jgi:hypothetical protein
MPIRCSVTLSSHIFLTSQSHLTMKFASQSLSACRVSSRQLHSPSRRPLRLITRTVHSEWAGTAHSVTWLRRNHRGSIPDRDSFFPSRANPISYSPSVWATFPQG